MKVENNFIFMSKFGVPLGVVYLPCSSVWACPLCYSDTGKLVRAGIFNGDFLFNSAVTLLPFVVFTVIGLILYYGPGNKK